MKIVTSEQMNALDRAAQEAGVSIMELMENAGRAVFEKAKDLLGAPQGSRAIIICGKGNNGGDGLVAARYLKQWGAQVEVFLAASAQDLKGAPKTNLEAALSAGVSVKEKARPEQVLDSCRQAALVIDAFLGTGVKGPVEGVAAEIIRALNQAGGLTLAVDIPSGVQADSGEVTTVAVRAQHTVTMGLPKWGLLNFPGAEYAGQITVTDIGLPPAAVEAMAITAEYLEMADAAALLPARSPSAHKGDCGQVLVIAGSAGYTGAAALCCMGALRMGAGLVTLAVPASLNDVMEAKLTEVITHPMPETEARTLSQSARKKILELAEKNDVVAMGPGLSLHPETAELVRELVSQIKIPMVLDADALSALAEDVGVMERSYVPIICTPHPGEMARLTGLSAAEVQKSRAALCQRLADSIGGVVVLKGAASLISDDKKHLRVNRTGNAGMASGGTGDVLTGMIAGLFARKLSPFDAASVGTYLHGLAGDLAAAEQGELGLIASDLLEKVPAATRQVQNVGRQTQ